MENLSVDSINELRRNARSAVRELGLLNDAYFEIGVTLAERHLLIELHTNPSLTMGEMAEHLLLDKSTVSRLIAGAVRKGYIKCIVDEKDKRKRFLKMTEKGEQTLNAFEPIAFNQTKDALLTLTDQEIEIVHQGIALYAKSLRNSRLENIADTERMSSCKVENDTKIESLFDIKERLKQLGFTLDLYNKKDERELYEIFQEVVETGSQFPYECSSKEEFHHRFFTPQGNVYVCRTLEGEVIGGFYLRANYSGRSAHIANAAYMIRSTHRGQGIGSLMIKASLHLAKERGLHAMQFNMVFSQNTLAVKLYERLGFKVVGIIPQAIRNPDDSFQDGFVMYRKLDDL